MKHQQIKYITISTLISSLVLLQACATSVSRLSDNGKKDEIIFPEIEKNAWVKAGSFPNIDNLRNVAPDMTKDQLYALLGSPHFSEGIGKVREWDYIFNFRTDANKTVETCQYKIIYSPNMRLRNTYWKPESCVQKLNVAVAQPQILVERTIEKIVAGPELTKTQMSADGLFEFNQSAISHLRPGGIEKLNRLSENLLSSGEITQLKIIGHTDRLGDDAYNMKLSEARAETIRQYLVAKKIPAERISAHGAGKSTPLVECKQSKRNETLINCLEPNRRFEVEAWTVRKI
jgi:OmpA-OmpF porin, OOP family